jgi:D-alanyl-D-alanine carboxypeptidase/D-alanyl-D-alanine-endopeptidase (penicillin-binding protein 4)
MNRRGSGASPLVVLGVVILVPALALFGLWRFAAGRSDDASGEPLPSTTVADPTAAAPADALSTPLLSFRRIPGLVARDLNEDAFAGAVNSFAAANLDSTSCLVVQLDGVMVGAGHNPDLPVIPASNQKLLVAAAALHVLGSDYTFTTEVRAATVSEGVVRGDLYLVGGGDPLLTSDDYDAERINGYPVLNATSLDTLADQVAASGITQVEGDIVGDGSRFDDEHFHAGWSSDVYVTEGGPYDALLVNDARFMTDDWQVANDPNAGAAEELTRLLEERGITIGGQGTTGTAPDGAAVITSIDSQPLPAVIAEMQTTSDNNTAELLVKEIGLVAGGEGTSAAGSAAVIDALDDMGFDTTGVVVDDGSGLSNDNRVTCRLLAEILERYVPGDDFSAGLPLAGQEGTTLNDAFVGSAVEGRLIAKTGTLRNIPFNADPPAVKALSGYLSVEGGGTIEFAFVMNSTGTLPDQGVYRPIWDSFANVLASYPSGPSAAELGPG